VIELAFIFLGEHGAAAGGHGETHALLDPHSWGLVFWSAITFGIVLTVLKKTAWGPILEQLDARAKTIEDALHEAERARAEAKKLADDNQKQVDKAKVEAQKILDEASRDAKRIVEEAHAKAGADAEATKLRALRDIDMAKAKAVDEIRQTSVELGLAIAEKVLVSEVDRPKQRRLVEDFAKSYGKN